MKENNLEKDIEEIEQNLPRKKKYSSIAAYSPSKEFIIKNPGFENLEFQGEKLKFQGKYNCILVNYNPIALQNPPGTPKGYGYPGFYNKISMFGFGFELFYDINRTSENHSTPKEMTGPGSELIIIPQKDPRIMIYFNTVRKHMWFAYKKDDEEAGKIIKGFIKKLREN